MQIHLIIGVSDQQQWVVKGFVSEEVCERMLQRCRSLHREWQRDPWLLPHPIDAEIQQHEQITFRMETIEVDDRAPFEDDSST